MIQESEVGSINKALMTTKFREYGLIKSKLFYLFSAINQVESTGL